MPTPRYAQIESILNTLKALIENPAMKDRQYALQENISFMESLKSFPQYVRWLFTRAPKIDGKRLEELTDFPIEEWDYAMHGKLIEMQRREKPGLVKPLVQSAVDFIMKENRDVVIANLGAGGMEVDRQIIAQLVARGFTSRVVFVAVDKSAVTHTIARENLQDIAEHISIKEIDQVHKDMIEEIRKNSDKKITVVMCKNNIFELEREFSKGYFDLVYHSLFKHHLTDAQKVTFDTVVRGISKKSLEYDGYKDWVIVPILTLVGWNHPVFLNAEIFSDLRFKEKKQLQAEGGNCTFYPGTGHYLLQ